MNESTHDPLGPALGLMRGCLLGIPAWCLIIIFAIAIGWLISLAI